jgi:type IV fimbrial biogenesis protein FimT
MGSGTKVGPAENKNVRETHAGFTVFEMLVVLLIAGIILGLGAPSFGEFRRNARLTSAANDLLGVGQLARTEAIKRQTTVSVCTSAAPGDREPACGGASFAGYITFVDADGDCARSAGETVLRANGSIERNVIANADGSCLSFGANGFLRASANSATHILFCDPVWGTELQPGTNQSAARGILVSETGRLQIVRDKPRIDKWDIQCAR